MEKGKHKEKNRYPLRAYIFNGTSAIYEVLDQQNTIYCSALSITKSDRCSLNQFIEMDENLLKEQEGNNEEMWELNVANKIIERMAKTVTQKCSDPPILYWRIKMDLSTCYG